MTPLFVHGHALIPVNDQGRRVGYRCVLCNERRTHADYYHVLACEPLRMYAKTAATHARETHGHLPVQFARNLAALARKENA